QAFVLSSRGVPRCLEIERKAPSHANAADCPEPSNCGRRRNRRYRSRVIARIPRNLGAADGLHARRLAALQRSDPRCQPDRGMLAAKYAAALQPLPRGIRIDGKRAAATGLTTATT